MPRERSFLKESPLVFASRSRASGFGVAPKNAFSSERGASWTQQAQSKSASAETREGGRPGGGAGANALASETRIHLLSPLTQLLFPEAVPLAALHLHNPASAAPSAAQGRSVNVAVVLHGVLGNRRNLLSLARALGAEPRGNSAGASEASEGGQFLFEEVICCDLRCHGDSGSGAFSLAAAASDVFAFLFENILERERRLSGEASCRRALEAAVYAAVGALSEGLLLRDAAISALAALQEAARVKVSLVGHSMGGLVTQEMSLASAEASRRFSKGRNVSPPIAALAVLDISPAPYWRDDRIMEVLNSHECTTITLPSLASASQERLPEALLPCSESAGVSRVSYSNCCEDVACRVPVPSEGGYSSEQLINALSDIPIEFFEDKANVEKSLVDLSPPLPHAVRLWLLQSLSTLQQRRSQQRRLLEEGSASLAQQVERGRLQGLPDLDALIYARFVKEARLHKARTKWESLKRPVDGDSPPELPPEVPETNSQEIKDAACRLQREAEESGKEVFSWIFDLPRLQEMVQRNRRKEVSAVPLSIHDPEQQQTAENQQTAAADVARVKAELLKLVGAESSPSEPFPEHSRPPSETPLKSFFGKTLFVHGENSPWFLGGLHERAVYRHFPNARVEQIKGAGHWLHIQQPKATLAALVAFFKEALV